MRLGWLLPFIFTGTDIRVYLYTREYIQVHVLHAHMHSHTLMTPEWVGGAHMFEMGRLRKI